MPGDIRSASKNEENGAPRELRTLGYVLRRTNYGEADRILNIITPQGKISALAKGARKEKSKLAGGIEMFTLADFNIHFGRGELGIVTSAKMRKFHSGIIKDFVRMELAAVILKKVSKASESITTEEYFSLVDQSLTALAEGVKPDLVEAWFLLKLKKVMGEELNLYRDSNGEKLSAEQTYDWHSYDRVLVPMARGEYGAREIKLLRLLTSSDLAVVRRIKIEDDFLAPVLKLAREGQNMV